MAVYDFCMTSLDQEYDLYNEYVDKRLTENGVEFFWQSIKK